MEKIKYNYKDFLEIFGDEHKIELIEGEIELGGRPFDEVVNTYLKIKEKKQQEQK